MFAALPKNHFGAILADPPWRFDTWNKATAVQKRGSKQTYYANTAYYKTMTTADLAAMPVADLAADDCALFLWVCWPTLLEALAVCESWGFKYKTCAFAWMKANAGQIEMFREDVTPRMLMGYWTRSNSEVCLLATRGKPKRLSAKVRQGIIEPAREHSRKPDCARDRIEQLVAGPYLELFARHRRDGWTAWGNETEKFK